MKWIAGCVILTLMCLLNTVSVGKGAINTKSCLKFHHAFTLDMEKFMGVWYEVKRLYDPLDPEPEDCVVMNYQLLQNGTFKIQKSFQKSHDGLPNYAGGTAQFKVFPESGIPQFYEWLNSTNAADQSKSVSIMTTDYARYALLYSCNPINATHNREDLWVLSRLLALENELVKMVMNLVIKNYVMISEKQIRVTEQSPEFCKPSFVDGTEMEHSTDGLVEASAGEPGNNSTDTSDKNAAECSGENSTEGSFETSSKAPTEVSNERDNYSTTP